MDDHGALHLALDVARMPALARRIRRQPLPPDLLPLIRIAAGAPDAIAAAHEATGENGETIRAAAILFLQQGLLQQDGDHYRTLGLPSDASRELIAEHGRWLMKWLHPDHDAAAWDSALAKRVLAAWHELKNPKRRARYDKLRARALALEATARRPSARQQGTTLRLPWIMVAVTADAPRRRPARRALAVLAIGIGALAVILLSERIAGTPAEQAGPYHAAAVRTPDG